MNKKTMSVLSFLVLNVAFAQKKDTINQTNIDEVVVTGQFSPQSIDKSIYKVEVIDQAQIKNMAATNVAEVLNQNLNMMIVPNSGSGDSQANILGLGGEYTKVLIDNIPVVNDQGLGNMMDLTKIGLNNIERIEIVKGSMGVEYGNNAVVGVINIITKKSSSKKFFGNVLLQEETVGKDYDWYRKGNGRHIQNLNLGYNIDKNWYISADINHNDFQGFKGKQNGYRYFNENNDGKRGYEWQPKDQVNGNAIIKYTKNKTSIFYKLNLLNEEINYRNPLITVKSFEGGNKTYYAVDRDYFTKRWLHQLNVQTNFGHVNYTGDFSYQTQTREYQNYTYYVPERQEVSRKEKLKYYDTSVYYSRGMFSNFLNNSVFNFQLGYELDHTSGFASPYALGNNNGLDLEKKVFNYANFISAEWQITPIISLRPGFRLALSDKFDEQYNFSLTGKWDVTINSYLRIIAGSANRFPTYDELYTFVVDNNHDIRGNENLNPETGYSVGIFYDFNAKKDSENISFSASAMYLEVKNRIESTIINFSPLQLTYINLNNYSSYLFSGGFQYKKNSFLFNSGVSLMGISKELIGPRGEVSPNDYFFYPEVNASASYKMNFGTLFALYYKYSGKNRQIIMEEDVQGNATFRVGKIGDYSMMNFTVSQPFFNNHIEIAAGIKNIFNVTDLVNTLSPGSAHSTATATQNYFYGRSYFARLIYNF